MVHEGICITDNCYNEPRNNRSKLCQSCFDRHLRDDLNSDTALAVDIDSPANEYF